MTQKKYQVFISSTYTDLIEERKKVQEILLMADCIPAGMEAFVATTEEQFQIIKKVIDFCDYYVLILGKRYGSINPETGLSYTEMEYEYAVSKGVPVLVFALDDSVVVSADKEEKDADSKRKLAVFKEKAMKNRLASIWKDGGDLSGKVAIAITKAKEEIVRPGWMRGDSYSTESLERIVKLQEENKAMSEEISNLKEQVGKLEQIPDLAFEGYSVEISYNRNECDKITKSSTLDKIFSYISLNIGEYEVHEKYLEDLVAQSVGYSRSDYCDDFSIKRIINQFVILGFLETWIVDDEGGVYKLTEKGKQMKNMLNAFRIEEQK